MAVLARNDETDSVATARIKIMCTINSACAGLKPTHREMSTPSYADILIRQTDSLYCGSQAVRTNDTSRFRRSCGFRESQTRAKPKSTRVEHET